jgi:hypothetical protein
LVVLAAVAAFVPAASASISFDVAGLAGTGVTAHVDFTYAGTSATTGTLTFRIENTTTVGGRISAFAFNVPTVGGSTFATIAGVGEGAGVIAMGPLPSQVTPENQLSSFNETGWFALWEDNGIKTPNAAGDFDFGIMNDNVANKFITDGVGSGPRIENFSDSNDHTTFTLQVSGTGLDTGDAGIEQAFLAALSAPQNDSGSYNFAVRFQGIGANGDSDLATTTVLVPAPGAAALAAFGLGLVGWMNRRRS